MYLSDVFMEMSGETDVIQHRVKLTDDTPMCCKPYRLPYAMREELLYARDGSSETSNVALCVAHHHR